MTPINLRKTTCKYCKSRGADHSGFCSKTCKVNYERNLNTGIDFVAPPIISRGLTEDEQRMINEFIAKRGA